MTHPEPSAAAPEPTRPWYVAYRFINGTIDYFTSDERTPTNAQIVCKTENRDMAAVIADTMNETLHIPALEHDYSQALAAIRELTAQNALLESALDAALDSRQDMFGVLVRAQQSLEQYGFNGTRAGDSITFDIADNMCRESYTEISLAIEAVNIPFDNDIYQERIWTGKE